MGFREGRALALGLRLGLGEIREQDVGLCLHFRQGHRQPLATLAFAAQLFVCRLERGLRVGAHLRGGGVGGVQAIVEIGGFVT